MNQILYFQSKTKIVYDYLILQFTIWYYNIYYQHFSIFKTLVGCKATQLTGHVCLVIDLLTLTAEKCFSWNMCRCFLTETKVPVKDQVHLMVRWWKISVGFFLFLAHVGGSNPAKSYPILITFLALQDHPLLVDKSYVCLSITFVFTHIAYEPKTLGGLARCEIEIFFSNIK